MKLNNLLNTTLAGLIACTLWSCDNISEADRLIYVKPAEVNRSVLIEDFTGQRCVNCPTATEEIEKLQEQYGEDAIIAVGIHSGPFGHRTHIDDNQRLPLCTETGDEYYKHWNIKSQPSILINRGTPIDNYAQYGAVVYDEVQKTTPLDLVLNLGYDADTRNVEINVSASASENVTGKLQVWVIEDNIVGQQSMPDGTINSNYVHQHVFRTSVTDDIFGDDFSVTDTASKNASYNVVLDNGWKPEDIAIVAFVSNTANGVLQVVKTELMTKD